MPINHKTIISINYTTLSPSYKTRHIKVKTESVSFFHKKCINFGALNPHNVEN